jgi:single-stranded DNA-binding protein
MRHKNKVVLIGRLSGELEWRELSSGGRLAVWRLVVERDVVRHPAAKIDTIRCIAFDPTVHEILHHCRHGDIIEIHGALRRRFWRTRYSPASVYEVEVRSALPLVTSARGEGAHDEPGPRLGAE